MARHLVIVRPAQPAPTNGFLTPVDRARRRSPPPFRRMHFLVRLKRVLPLQVLLSFLASEEVPISERDRGAWCAREDDTENRTPSSWCGRRRPSNDNKPTSRN